MDKLDKDLLKRIEGLLNIEFKEWQINYLLDVPMILDMRITRRGSGKTLVYIIKLLFTDDYPIRAFDISDIASVSDWWSFEGSEKAFHKGDTYYNRWFQRYLLEIYECLKSGGIDTRPVLRTRKEHEDYEWLKKTFAVK